MAQARLGRLGALAGMYFLAAVVGDVRPGSRTDSLHLDCQRAGAGFAAAQTDRRDWPAALTILARPAANAVMTRTISWRASPTGANIPEIGVACSAARAWPGPVSSNLRTVST
jgi:hypothetical protein